MPISQTLHCYTKIAFSTNFYRAGASILPISTAPAPRFYQFLPRRRLDSTNFYRFLPRRGRRFTRKNPYKTTVRKHNSTNFYRAVFEILPISTGRFSKFYQFLPGGFRNSTVFCRFLPVSTGRFLSQFWLTLQRNSLLSTERRR